MAMREDSRRRDWRSITAVSVYSIWEKCSEGIDSADTLSSSILTSILSRWVYFLYSLLFFSLMVIFSTMRLLTSTVDKVSSAERQSLKTIMNSSANPMMMIIFICILWWRKYRSKKFRVEGVVETGERAESRHRSRETHPRQPGEQGRQTSLLR